jgi:hypothetical protein
MTCDGKEVGMLKMALVIAVLVSSNVAYALSNSDLMQLNLQISLLQGQQTDVTQLLGPKEQARLLQEEDRLNQIGRQQQEKLKQKQYVQELLWEWQRRQNAHEFGERRQRDLLMERRQTGLFQ